MVGIAAKSRGLVLDNAFYWCAFLRSVVGVIVEVTQGESSAATAAAAAARSEWDGRGLPLGAVGNMTISFKKPENLHCHCNIFYLLAIYIFVLLLLQLPAPQCF